MELSTYFRINAENTGQFERTLIIADEGSYVSYLEGCTAPMRDENQLHAAVVELVALDDAEIKYSTVQNWYPGDEQGRGGIYNFVTKRGACLGARSKISWTQVETGSAITWKYPSVMLRGADSVGEFYSVALTRNRQQADTGTKMVHIGPRTKSTIVSKGISAGHSRNSYRGLVRMNPAAAGARNHTQCDSLLIGDDCGANTFPYIESKLPSAIVEHEATTSKVSDEQLFLCQQHGIDPEKAVANVLAGRPGYEVTAGSLTLDDTDLRCVSPKSALTAGCSSPSNTRSRSPASATWSSSNFSNLHYRPDDELRYEVGRRTVTGNTDRFTLLFRRPWADGGLRSDGAFFRIATPSAVPRRGCRRP